MRKFFSTIRATGILVCLVFTIQQASSQNGTVKAPVKDTTLNPLETDIIELASVVIGTRSRAPRSKVSTPVPVDVIRTKDVKPFAQTDISQMLTYTAPSFQSARQTISDGTDHIDPAGLRGLGPDQTLVLLNGKRYHNTALVNINGTVGRGSVGVDFNTIPAAAIERIEVLRDGAAAQYGSDAIAGVINVVLKKEFNGLTVSALTGQNFTNVPYKGGTKFQDGVNQQVELSYGIARKKWYLAISAQWSKRYQTNRSGEDNFPLIYLGNAGAFPANPYTTVSNTDFRRWLMDQDAAIVQQRGYDRHNIVAGNSFSENIGGFINAGTKLSDRLELYLTVGAGHRDGKATGQSRNPNSVAQQPVLADGKRFYENGFLPQITPSITDWSAITGVTYKAGSWDIDLSNTVGRSTVRYETKNTGNASLPATNNVQTEFYNGTLSFLQNTSNLDFSRNYKFSEIRSLNIAFGAEYRYEIFQIKAGEANSYINGQRQAKVDSIPPYPGTTTGTGFPTAVAPASGVQVFPGFKKEDAVKANRNIYAVYGDVELTLGKVLLDGAVRYENYSEKGFSYDNLGGKLSARYEFTSQFSVRGSVSNGFRAPSLHQRYFQNTSTQFVNAQPSNSLTANNYSPIVRNAFGIKELKPEHSTNYTLGFVGRLTRSLVFTVDAYFISIRDRIVLSTPFNRSNPLVNKILNDNGVDPSTSALQFWTNAVNTETKGIDAVITERVRVGTGIATLSLAANFNKNQVVGGLHTNSIIEAPANNPSIADPTANPANDLALTLFDRQQKGRIETAQPRSKINFTATYSWKKWDFLARAVRFGEVEFLNNIDPGLTNKNTGAYFNDIAFGVDQVFGAKITTDLVVSYKLVTGVTISAGANNLFDVYPDRIYIDPRNELSAVYANPIQGVNKTAGGYNSGRDASNRGRYLFGPNQFGFNGRFLFTRITLEVDQWKKH
jgi:iron complex outermembrane receptor protein